MLPTSGTFNFQSIQIELIIREAFERIGISGEFIEPVKLDSAKRSIDLLFLDWMNKSVNLWTLEKAYLQLVPLTGQYILDTNVSNIIQANLRTSTRVLDGVPSSVPGGIAANAFDGDPGTACTQTGANGYIAYIYTGSSQQINFIGITSNQNIQYTLTVEITQDLLTWTTLFDIPAQSFQKGVNAWFDVPTSMAAAGYRIRETGGAILDIQEIYFNNNVVDFAISNVSREEYYTYPNKYLASRPSVYYLDRQISPVLTIWPIPTANYNCLQYTYKKMIQDAGLLYTNTVQIPARFYPALIWGVSWQLALKFNPQAAQMLKIEYEQAFDVATREDSESTPISIMGDTNSYRE